jgi:hypothetical protein
MALSSKVRNAVQWFELEIGWHLTTATTELPADV